MIGSLKRPLMGLAGLTLAATLATGPAAANLVVTDSERIIKTPQGTNLAMMIPAPSGEHRAVPYSTISKRQAAGDSREPGGGGGGGEGGGGGGSGGGSGGSGGGGGGW